MTKKSLRDHFKMPEADLVDNLPHGYGPTGMQRATSLLRNAGYQSQQKYKPESFSSRTKAPLLGAASGLAMTISAISGYSAPRAKSVIPMRTLKPSLSMPEPSFFGIKKAA